MIHVAQRLLCPLAGTAGSEGRRVCELGAAVRRSCSAPRAVLTGKEWSRATVSAAESGWDSRGVQRRVRHFEVNDVTAFAIALRLPVIWFFLPPPTTPSGAWKPRLEPWITIHNRADEADVAMSSQQLLRLIFTHRDEGDRDDLMGRRLYDEKLTWSRSSPDSILFERLTELERLLSDMRKSRS
jgi:hypothetical protein